MVCLLYVFFGFSDGRCPSSFFLSQPPLASPPPHPTPRFSDLENNYTWATQCRRLARHGLKVWQSSGLFQPSLVLGL